MFKLGERNEKVCAITAAMADGTGLKRFSIKYPDRFFDVGIAEQHAVTFAAGLAMGGFRPIVAIYSSFLQRAYDQIIHDVSIQNLPVIFAIEGIFDLSYMSSIPNMTVMAPKNKWELSDMLKFALTMDSPVSIRYPRGVAYAGLKEYRKPIELGKSEIIYEEEDIALFAIGSMVKTSEKVRDILKEMGYSCSLINARFVKPLDEETIDLIVKDHKLIVTLEENVLAGGYGEKVNNYITKRRYNVKVTNIGLPDEYIEHGNVDILKKETGIDTDTIVKRIIADRAVL